ncbi:TonB family protein [Hyalangium rubrum]|uniref:TonB family protein n=1 Tax=Hyalangium rubrum TaxID=3103134 RepID=A0ABU5HF68_9BACT|nr:TonB family protein [Hyalangium sp. s54d21]MDY7232001.1 TonB family protein [Hyalangium sp. s54d21]
MKLSRLVLLTLLWPLENGHTQGASHPPDNPKVIEATLVPPSLLSDSPATYPSDLKGESGEVSLELLVDETGQVAQVSVVDATNERFAQAAREAARHLSFNPATQGGQPVAVRLPFVYRFEPPAPPPELVRLRGSVRTRGTRRPLSTAALFVDGGPSPTQTDAEGLFTLELPPGVHALEVRAAGHVPQTFRETLQTGQELEVIYRLEPLTLSPYETVVRDERERTEVSRITLREQELREVPGTQGDPFRVVMLMPGVGSLASGASYPVVRGSQPAATGFFLDGIRVPMLYHLLVGSAVVHPDFIESLDFHPGMPSVRYGRLLGGAVEGHVRRPREQRLHATAYADLINSGVFVEQPFPSTGTSVSVAGRISYSALLLSAVANTLQQPGAGRVRANFWDYQARVEQKVGTARVRLFALGSSDGLGVRPDASTPSSEGGGLATRFHRVDLRGQSPLGGGEAELGLTLGLDDMGLLGEQGPQRVGEFALRQASVSARARWTRQLTPELGLTLGADAEHRRAALSILGTALPPGAREMDPSNPLQRPSTIALMSGAHVEFHWRPSPRWSVVPGLRADAYHLVPGLTHWAVEPRLAVRHALTEALTLKAGAGLFHQPPTVLLHVPVMDTLALRYGLQAGAQVAGGVEWKVSDVLELSTEAFFNPLWRTVELDLGQVAENYRRRGVGLPDPSARGLAYGFELMARRTLGRQWFGWVSYSFLRSRRWVRINRHDDMNRVVDQIEASVPFAFEQAHVLNTALSFRFANNYTLGTVVHFNTGRPESGEITSRSHRQGRDAQGQPIWVREDRDRVTRLAPFVRVDLRAAKSWTLEDFTLDAYLDVLNVSLQQEVLAYDYQRNVLADGTTQLERKPLRLPVILPMLGVKASY